MPIYASRLTVFKSFLYSFLSVFLSFFIAFFLVVYPLNSYAYAYENVRSLAMEKGWHALMYYKKVEGNQYISQADEKSFFVSETGKFDPIAELTEFIHAIESNPQEISCRFPARLRWVSERLGLKHNTSSCIKYDQWRASFPTDNLSVGFVSPYMGDPASIFGHSILIFSDHSDTSRLLSRTANYSANIERDPSVLTYIVKGLSGGFKGVVDTDYMYRRIRRYGENEGRDIWEYNINFSAAEVNFLIEHLWEIKGESFDYYFLNENCGYRILALLAAVRPESISLKGLSHKAIPNDTIKRMDQAGIIGDIYFWPSRLRKFEASTGELSFSERHLVRQIALGELSVEHFLASDQTSIPVNILQHAHEYLSLLIQTQKVSSISGNARIHEILVGLSTLGTDTQQALFMKQDGGPIYSHESSRLRLGYVSSKEHDSVQVGYRLAGHTIEDPSAGQTRGISAEYFTIDLVLEEGDRLEFERASILNIKSYVPSSYFFPRVSWAVDSGARREFYQEGRYHIVKHLSLASGISADIKGHTFSLLGSMRASNGHLFRDTVSAELGVKVNIQYESNAFNYQVYLHEVKNVSESLDNTRSLGFVASVPLFQRYALNLKYDKIEQARFSDRSWSMMLNYYF